MLTRRSLLRSLGLAPVAAATLPVAVEDSPTWGPVIEMPGPITCLCVVGDSLLIAWTDANGEGRVSSYRHGEAPARG